MGRVLNEEKNQIRELQRALRETVSVAPLHFIKVKYASTNSAHQKTKGREETSSRLKEAKTGNGCQLKLGARSKDDEGKHKKLFDEL